MMSRVCCNTFTFATHSGPLKATVARNGSTVVLIEDPSNYGEPMHHAISRKVNTERVASLQLTGDCTATCKSDNRNAQLLTQWTPTELRSLKLTGVCTAKQVGQHSTNAQLLAHWTPTELRSLQLTGVCTAKQVGRHSTNPGVHEATLRLTRELCNFSSRCVLLVFPTIGTLQNGIHGHTEGDNK